MVDSADTKTSTNTSKCEINPVAVRLAPFWAHSPAIWFVQAEAQFNLGRIVNDQSKYNFVVSSLPQDIAESIADILQKPPKVDAYTKLKDILIERNSLSLERRVKKLISDEEMGDKKPSDFYRTLQRLTGSSNTFGDDLIKKIWFQRIPHGINIALIPLKDDSLEKLLEVADQVWEAFSTTQVSSISKQNMSLPSTSKHSEIVPIQTSGLNHSDLRYEKLEHEIHELKNMISNMNSNRNSNRGRSFERNKSPSFRRRTPSRKRFNSRGRLCFYHFKFGDNANKCTLPCERNGVIKTDASKKSSN